MRLGKTAPPDMTVEQFRIWWSEHGDGCTAVPDSVFGTPCFFHDYAYYIRESSRFDADVMFLANMIVETARLDARQIITYGRILRAFVYFFGVRVFGWAAWIHPWGKRERVWRR